MTVAEPLTLQRKATETPAVERAEDGEDDMAVVVAAASPQTRQLCTSENSTLQFTYTWLAIRRFDWVQETVVVTVVVPFK